MFFFRFFFLLLWAVCVQSQPYFLLTSTRSKCLSVIAPHGQTISIAYKAPDMKLAEGDEEEESAEAAHIAEAAQTGVDGQDSEWNKRMKEKLERMKSKKMRDMSITVSQKIGVGGALAGRQRKMYGGVDAGTVSGSGRVRQELTQRQGSIQFQTGEDDGTVDICVQSIIANKNNPTRVSLNVTMDVTADAKEESPPQEGGEPAQEGGEKKEGDLLAPDSVKAQMSRLERDLQTLSNRVKAILNNADFNKDQEVAFHEQSVAMSRASTYWPAIQLVVLLVTGFTQANHIVRYMKSRHIV